MFRIDLHVHTQRYSECAESLDPRQLGRAAQLAGLDAILLAEHDVMWSPDELSAVQQHVAPTRLFRGAEVTTPDGHFVVVGLANLSGIPKGIDAVEMAVRVRAAGGAVILAHPQRSDGALVSRLSSIRVDAVEVFSATTRGAHSLAAHDIAKRWGCAEVAGSDAHALEVVGAANTLFERAPRDELELAAMIRRGLGKPCLRSTG